MRWIRLLLRVLVIVASVLVVVILLLLIALQSRAGRQRLAQEAARQIDNAMPQADVRIDEIAGNLLRSPSVRGLTISHNGSPVIRAEHVEVRYDVSRLLRGDMAIEEVVVRSPVIDIERGPQGISLFRAFAREPTGAGPVRPFVIDSLVVVDGRVVLGPKIDTLSAVDLPDQLRNVQAELAFARTAQGFRIDITGLSFLAVSPELTVRQLAGSIRRQADGWWFEDVMLQTAQSSIRLHGSVSNLDELGNRAVTSKPRVTGPAEKGELR